MKTWVGIGVILAVTVIVAAILATRDDGPDAVRATVGADGVTTFAGEGNGRTEPLASPSGKYFVVGACVGDESFALTLVDGDESTRLLSHAGGVFTRIANGSTFNVTCSKRWVVALSASSMP